MFMVAVMALCYRFALPKDGTERLNGAIDVAVTLGLLMVLVGTAPN